MLKWFESYLSGRTYSVRINQEYSNPVTSLHGVPQGSVLRPLLFNGYCLPLAKVIEKHNIAFHMYAVTGLAKIMNFLQKVMTFFTFLF